LLALLEALGGKAPPEDFQNYLFLFSRLQENPSYDFVPYTQGPFSFQAEADLRALVAARVLKDGEEWRLSSKGNYLGEVEVDDQAAVKEVVGKFSSYKGEKLARFVFKEYPYFASRSEFAKKILSGKDLEAAR